MNRAVGERHNDVQMSEHPGQSLQYRAIRRSHAYYLVDKAALSPIVVLPGELIELSPKSLKRLGGEVNAVFLRRALLIAALVARTQLCLGPGQPHAPAMNTMVL